MEKLKTIKLSDVVKSEQLDAKSLSEVKGGADIMLLDGCYSGICSVQLNPEFCAGAAICTHGIAG